MTGKQCSIFMDNALGHPKVVCMKNVKVIFLPSNTTTQLQLLDQGIIQMFKQHHRKCTLHAIIAEKDDETKIKSLSVFDAVQWISSAIQDVEASMITACFQMAGFQCDSNDDYPKGDIPLSQLIADVADQSDDCRGICLC